MDYQSINPYESTLRQQIYSECRAMAEYALAKGLRVPAACIQQIEAYEIHDLSEEESFVTQKIRFDLDITKLVAAHDLLARLIEPATPKTVLLLDLEEETTSWLKFLGPVTLVRQLMVAAIASLFIFVGLISTPYMNADDLEQAVLSADGWKQVVRLVFYMVAAALGASFAALYQVNQYLSNGTYDPCHRISYWMRFLMGVISGLLLAVLISQEALQETQILAKGILRPLLAIVGGFSADLLYTFLNRVVEALKSLFESSTRDILEAKNQEAKARLVGQDMNNRAKLAQNLMHMQQQLGADMSPEQAKQMVNSMIQSLMQSK